MSLGRNSSTHIGWGVITARLVLYPVAVLIGYIAWTQFEQLPDGMAQGILAILVAFIFLILFDRVIDACNGRYFETGF